MMITGTTTGPPGPTSSAQESAYLEVAQIKGRGVSQHAQIPRQHHIGVQAAADDAAVAATDVDATTAADADEINQLPPTSHSFVALQLTLPTIRRQTINEALPPPIMPLQHLAPAANHSLPSIPPMAALLSAAATHSHTSCYLALINSYLML